MSYVFPLSKVSSFSSMVGHLASRLDFSPWSHRKLPLSILQPLETSITAIPKLHSEFCSSGLILFLILCSMTTTSFWLFPHVSVVTTSAWSPTQHARLVENTDRLHPSSAQRIPAVPIPFNRSETGGKKWTHRKAERVWGGKTKGMESKYDRL